MVADLVLLGLGIALQPFRLSAFILILGTKDGTRKGLEFVLGWLACLVLVIAVVVLITGGRLVRFHTLPATVVQIAKLALGVALIVIAAVQSRKRGRPRILKILGPASRDLPAGTARRSSGSARRGSDSVAGHRDNDPCLLITGRAWPGHHDPPPAPHS